MKKLLVRGGLGLVALLVIVALALTWHVRGKRPQRSGELALAGLTSAVTVRYDEAGVPHVQAGNEPDLYRALGWLHAQDRLFQMEMLRRLARGELAEVLGPKLIETDRLFRTLRLKAEGDARAAKLDRSAASTIALQAYLDGINAFQQNGPTPLEFEILGIPKRAFTTADVISVVGYQAYSFANALRAEPVLTHVRDRLGADYLRIFEPAWNPRGVVAPAAASSAVAAAARSPALLRVAELSDRIGSLGLPQFEGSNAWALSGARTASGKPLLAGDPHIAFGTPAVWWEAHLQAPGFELYGHFQPLNPMALLGHNQRFGWSLTMFQNDDIDLVVEKTDAQHAGQVFVGGQWVALQAEDDTINVKGAAPVAIKLLRSPHGPIINEALGPTAGEAPVAMWWAILATDNPAVEGFYQLNRADTLAKARQAASLVHAPGLNIVWAHVDGDIGWWAAAKLPQRPNGVDGRFMLDGSKPEADKPGFLPFERNPQEENPARGYIVSANHQPATAEPVPGYYAARDRVQRLDEQLRDARRRWDTTNTQALQLDAGNAYGPRLLAPLLVDLRAAAQGDEEKALVEHLAQWRGDYPLESTAGTLFRQFQYELVKAAMADEMRTDGGDALFSLLLRTRALDEALPRLAADAASPWWDVRGTPEKETRAQVVAIAWRAALAHLKTVLGDEPQRWTWARAHTLTHVHPLGRQAPLDKLFNVGPFAQPGSHEVPDNLDAPLGPAPWAVVSGPSTRRIIDFAAPDQALGINPVGQSGVWGDVHYDDQARRYAQGQYRHEALAEADVAARAVGTLVLRPPK